jgi:DNA polymerase III subunit epsilon
MSLSFVALDVETANPDYSSVCQIGTVRVENGALTGSLVSLVDPEMDFDSWYIEIHGITPEMVAGQPRLPDLAGRLSEFVGSAVVASHTHFDRVAVERAFERYELAAPGWPWLDTACVARRTWPEFAEGGYGLVKVAARCGVEFRHHDALEDARAAAEILLVAMRETGLDISGWLRRVRQPIDPQASRVSREGSPEGPLSGEVVVFTGALSSMLRTQAAELAAGLGCDVRNSVTSKTTMLVVGQQDLSKLGGYTKSTKQRTAEKLISEGAEITILSEADFRRLDRIYGRGA